MTQGGKQMRKYSKDGRLCRVVCNNCGHSVQCTGGILKEEFFAAHVSWGYFSERDGQKYTWDLCQTCYDGLTKAFKIAPEISEETELMTAG